MEAESDLVAPEPEVTEPEVTEPEALQAVAVAPVPAAVSPVAVPVVADPRPHLQIMFVPAAASATDAQASVEFTLTVSNIGDAPARRVRMEARMLAMGQDHDAALAAFFAAPLERPIPVAAEIPPGVHADLRAQVSLPRSAVVPIQVKDRTLFVPLVAFNVLYDHEDGHAGQVATSYVVGRETRPPAAKMAPFRLDQGPRIYREVGQREHGRAQVA